jgi:hypothetical protein
MKQETMNAHTPGPWVVRGLQSDRPQYNEARHIYASDDRASGGTGCVANVTSSDANAALIAVAPDLADMLAQMIAAADDVAACWESGDLAGAVTALQSVRGEAADVLAKAGGVQ